MLERIVEPELMLDTAQAEQYAAANFETAHSRYPQDFLGRYPNLDVDGLILDIGCGPADVTIRFAKLFADAQVIGIDGSPEMLRLAEQRVENDSDPHLASRVRFEEARIPLDEAQYTANLILCNGALHHFHDPLGFWRTVQLQAAPGAYVFVTDLLRPETEAEVTRLVEENCSNDHPVHVADYRNSLRAAFTPAEIFEQLEQLGLSTNLTIEVPDPSRVLIHGQLNREAKK